MLEALSDYKIEITTEKPKSGMWHCGPNNCWITVTHLPTMASVRVYSGGKSQHKTREIAMDAIEYILASTGSDPCIMPELLEEER